MKKLFPILLFMGIGATLSAQVTSTASFLRAREKSDVTIPFRFTDEGKATPIEWGLDLAWLSEENIRRGINFAGQELIDIIRTSYMPTSSVEDGVLSAEQISKITERANIIKRYAKPNVGLNINDDHASVDSWYNAGGAVTSVMRGQRWAKVIDLTIKKYKELGLTNLVSISPYNEPDYGWDQGYSNATRKNDFLNTCKSLKQDFDGAYNGVRICGGNTLNDDYAYEWWNYLKAQLDEGNTHQLAGTFDNYASFFQKVREYGHHATADELHNTMEAMVGVEYGMQTGIWWGTCEHSRSQFMKATYHANPGRRLAYAEHRNNWTAASVYRHADGKVQAFGGTSERQGVETKYAFASLDRPVWFNGEPGREYLMTLPGGTGYQKGQSNAETVVDVQSDDDIMPHIDGTYKVVNMNSGQVMGFTTSPTSGWVSTAQKKNNNTQKWLQWVVKPVPLKVGDDFSYYIFTLNTDKDMVLDIRDWNLNAGADVGVYPGGLGSNEQWFLEYAGNGAFYIRSRFSAKYLGVRNNATTVSANIEMQDFTGYAGQQWRFLPASVTPEFDAPAAPTALYATPQSASVCLEWTASTDSDVSGYTILRSNDGQSFYTIAKDVEGTSFTDNEAEDGTPYFYKVYAMDKSLNRSEPTAAVEASATGEADCIAHLTFNQSLFDTTRQGNHAALYGTAAWEAGKEGDALALSGTDNFVQLPYTVATHNELTVACWAYWRGGSNWQRLWDFGTGTNQYLFFTPKSDGGMRFAIKNGGGEQQISVSQSLPQNTWVHIAVTLGTDGAKLYINGELKGTNASVSIRPSDIRPVFNYIGRSQFTADPYFKGSVDDFRIYNHALTLEEVKSIADGTDAIHNIPTHDASNGQAYDLSGRHFGAGPLAKKGVSIENGRKVLH